MTKGTKLTANLNRSQMALFNFMMWYVAPDENDAVHMQALVDEIKDYTNYKNSLKKAKSSNDLAGEPIVE